MITESTVLVLGAGASLHCGFPTGKKLFDHISSGCRVPGLPSISPTMSNCGFQPSDFEAFAKELNYSGLCSVDQFLEYQPDWIDYGKHAIAACLLPLEKMDALFLDTAEEPNWYKVLYGRLNAPFERFAENKISVITYNYDRSLEQFLFTSLKYTHKKSDKECADMLDSMPIIHLHGRFSPIYGQLGQFVQYGSEINPLHIKQCAKNIRIIHEPMGKDPEYLRAHEVLSRARKIAFLGFGFHSTNLERLLPEGLMKGLNPAVYATVSGFGAADRDAIGVRLKQLIPSGRINIAPSAMKINDILHDYPIMPIF